MNQFVIEFDNQKTLDFEAIEEQYGSNLAQMLRNDFEYAIENKLDWKLEIEDDSKYSVSFMFVLRSSVTYYEVSRKRKSINDNYIVGKVDCRKFLELMDSLEKVEQ